MNAIVTLSELNDLKLTTITQLAAVATLTVICDVKYVSINESKNTWSQIADKLQVANYQEHLRAYGHKVDRFNGKWSNNPAKLAALLSAAAADGPVWIFEDDVYCREWESFLQAYASVTADLITSTTPVENYPWFDQRGWLVGDRRHVSHGVAGLYAFRISPQAARRVVSALREEGSVSHHEVFVPWAVASAGMAIVPLLPVHAATMWHNAAHNTSMCLRESECKDGSLRGAQGDLFGSSVSFS